DAPGGSLIATGGRVLNVVAVASDFRTARDRAYEAIAHIRLDGSHYRTDIAARVAE
ncbi:phosphoribosylglycinamide synthetase C domain-containing protein, partial [Microbacterium sp. BF1]